MFFAYNFFCPHCIYALAPKFEKNYKKMINIAGSKFVYQQQVPKSHGVLLTVKRVYTLRSSDQSVLRDEIISRLEDC